MLKKSFKYLIVFSLPLLFWGSLSVFANWPEAPDGFSVGGWLGEFFDLDATSSGELVLKGNLVADEPVKASHVVTKSYVDNNAGGSQDIKIFETDDVWTKPATVKLVEVRLLAGGGGGGAPKSATTYRCGGGGGGGEFKKFTFLASELPETVDVTIGRGGAGGNPDQNGEDGEDTQFGSYLIAHGGKGGSNYGYGGKGGMSLAVSPYNGDHDRIPSLPSGGTNDSSRCSGVDGWYSAGGGGYYNHPTTLASVGCSGGDSMYGGAGGGVGANWITGFGGRVGSVGIGGSSPWGHAGNGGAASFSGSGTDGQDGGIASGGGGGGGGAVLSGKGGKGGDGLAIIISY